MKSIETTYKGHRFRSRTEARWAVFFDTIGIKYNYEHEGVELPSGCYLPDFFLPNFDDKGCYVEVKGVFTEDEIEKCKSLCLASRYPVLMLDGVPDFKCYYYYEIIKSLDFESCKKLNCGKESPYDYFMCSLSDTSECYAPERIEAKRFYGIVNAANKYGERMYSFPGFETGRENRFLESDWYESYRDAVYAARSARFEFGQSGSTL